MIRIKQEYKTPQSNIREPETGCKSVQRREAPKQSMKLTYEISYHYSVLIQAFEAIRPVKQSCQNYKEERVERERADITKEMLIYSFESINHFISCYNIATCKEDIQLWYLEM
jgi:hypothetical protein